MIEQISYYSTVFRDGNDPCDTMCTDLHMYYEFWYDISSLIMGKKRFFIYLIRRLATIWVYGKSRFKFSYK